jgi:hypothetical protein
MGEMLRRGRESLWKQGKKKTNGGQPAMLLAQLCGQDSELLLLSY